MSKIMSRMAAKEGAERKRYVATNPDKRNSGNAKITIKDILIIEGTTIVLRRPVTENRFMLRNTVRGVKNPFVDANGIPLEKKDHLFFEFERNRRDLLLSLMPKLLREKAQKAEANLNAKMSS